MINYKNIFAKIFYFYIPVLIVVSIILFIFIPVLRNNLDFVSVIIYICLIYIIIFWILNWREPSVFFTDILWNEDAGAKWQRDKIKVIQEFCLKIDKIIKKIFNK